MASRNLTNRSFALVHRAALGAAAVFALAGHPCAALAQDAQSLGLRDTGGPSAATDDDLGLGASGLRGTGAAIDAGAAPVTPPDTANAPDTSDATGPKPKPSPTKAPETSTAKARVGAPRLPALVPYPTSTRPRGAAIDTIQQTVTDPTVASQASPGSVTIPPVLSPTVAAIPAPPLRRPKPDPTPFAPIGFTIGTLRLTPFIEQSLGFDSNPDQVGVGVKPSAFSRTEGGFDLLSLWSSNELRANMHGAYNDFFSNPAANRPDAAGTVDYRYDVSRDIAIDAEGRFAVTTQRPGSPELNVAVTDRPLVTSYGTSLGGSDTINRLTLALHGTFDRTEYANGVLSDGTVIRLDDQNFNDYGVVGRVGYEISPSFKPFAELTVDSRVHDQRIDQSGFARDSTGVAGRIGATLELSRLLTGEISVGYEDRSYEDSRLRDLHGPLVDASLAYAVTPLTTLSLRATTSFDETTVPGASGAESRSVSLQVSHALLRNLTLTGIVGYLNTDYIGASIVENTISGTLKASYNINRSLILEASYNHQSLFSSLPASSFDQDVFLVGLRVQH